MVKMTQPSSIKKPTLQKPFHLFQFTLKFRRKITRKSNPYYHAVANEGKRSHWPSCGKHRYRLLPLLLGLLDLILR